MFDLLLSVMAAAETAEDAATTATTAAQQALAAAHTHGNMSLIMSFAEESGRLYYGTTGTATAAEAAAALAAATAAAEAAASKAAIDDAATSMASTWSSGKISQAIAGAALPPATRSTLGGIIVGDGLDVSTDGTASVVRPALPVGSVFAFAGQTAPAHCLVCDGSAVSRTAYAALFAVIGEIYGEGDGSTTFVLPDLRGRFVEGTPADGTTGTSVAAGLPDIKGRFSNRHGSAGGDILAYMSGAYAAQGSVTAMSVSTTSSVSTSYVDFAASRSNSIYGNSDTVQPPALTMLFVIVAE